MLMNRERLIQLCAESDFKVDNVYFKRMKVLNYTWMSKIKGERTFTDYVFIARVFKD